MKFIEKSATLLGQKRCWDRALLGWHTKAENATDEFFGLGRLCDVVNAYWAGAAEAVKDAVVADVRGFIEAQTVYDDLTLLVVKQK